MARRKSPGVMVHASGDFASKSTASCCSRRRVWRSQPDRSPRCSEPV